MVRHFIEFLGPWPTLFLAMSIILALTFLIAWISYLSSRDRRAK
jgi:hypothetical protein